MRMALQTILALLILIAGIGIAQAEKRVALLIGNSDYQHTSRLINPKNDASVLAQKFREIGFEKVTLKLDLDATALRKTLAKFSRDSTGADIAVIYFAGHGIEVDGTNYVVPTDAKLSHVDDVDFEAVEMSKLMRSLNRAKKLKLVILDACRNNPFKNNMTGVGGSRSVGRGLARVSPSGSDTLVAYAAREGTLAADGDNKHSPYAQALIKHLSTPDLDIRLLFGRVRDDVLAATGRRQEPFTYGSLPGRRIFLAATAVGDVDDVQFPPSAQKIQQMNPEALFWSSVRHSQNAAAIEEFLKQFPDGTFAGLAHIRLKDLTKKVTVLPTSEAPSLESAGTIRKVLIQLSNVRDAPNHNAKALGNIGGMVELGRTIGNGWYELYDRPGQFVYHAPNAKAATFPASRTTPAESDETIRKVLIQLSNVRDAPNHNAKALGNIGGMVELGRSKGNGWYELHNRPGQFVYHAPSE